MLKNADKIVSKNSRVKKRVKNISVKKWKKCLLKNNSVKKKLC